MKGREYRGQPREYDPSIDGPLCQASALYAPVFVWLYLADQGTDLRTMRGYLGHRDPKHTAHDTRVAGH
jgi:hypothetical protein